MIYVLVALQSELPHLGNLDRKKFKLVYTGVGKINAAISTLSAVNMMDCEKIINFGTAGTLSSNLIGQIHEVGVVRQRDMDARPLAQLGVTPFDETSFGGDIMLDSKCQTILSSGDNFVRSAPEMTSHLVDMEGYAIAKVSMIHKKPVQLIKYASDMADKDSDKDWVENMTKGSDLFLELLEKNNY